MVVGLPVLVIGGYSLGWSWTGLGESHHSDTIQPAKNFWDWLQLLIVPLALAAATFWFGTQQNKRDQRATEDREQAAVLEAYFDKIGELLLDKQLRSSHDQDEVRQIAHARTLAALSRLNPGRKQILLHFLHDTGLFGKGPSIVSMEGANLSGTKLSVSSTSSGSDSAGTYLINASYEEEQLEGVDLSEAQLGGANLRKANLKSANLRGALLISADLSEADLTEADLSGADLRFAKLCSANLMQATFKGANLESANLQGIYKATFKGGPSYDVIGQLEREAKSLRRAIMEDGSSHD